MRKYLLYAVGEILLVMIGILLALQVNNWNEERKDRQLEQDYLSRLQEDFLASVDNVEDNINSLQDQISLMNKMTLRLREGKLPKGEYGIFAEGFYRFGKIPPPSLVTGTLAELSATGRIIIIQNDTLRQALQNLQDRDKDIREILNFIVTRTAAPIQLMDSKVIMVADENGNIEPDDWANAEESVIFDFSEMTKDPKVVTAVSTVNHTFGVILRMNRSLQGNYEDILAMLNAELSKFEHGGGY